jgi:hypothetical protein
MRYLKIANVQGEDERFPHYVAGVENVVSIRCLKHLDVPPYNYNEGVGECAACKVIEQSKLIDEAIDRVGQAADTADNYIYSLKVFPEAAMEIGLKQLRDTLRQLFFDLGGAPDTWAEFDSYAASADTENITEPCGSCGQSRGAKVLQGQRCSECKRPL